MLQAGEVGATQHPRGRKEVPFEIRDPFLDKTAELARKIGENLVAEEEKKPDDPEGQAAYEAAEHARDDDMGRLREELIKSMRRHDDLGFVLLDVINDTPDERTALRLARVLRFSHEPALLDHLRDRVTSGPNPIDRRVAIIALDGEHPDIWYGPVTTAYAEDRDATVRDEASMLLSHALADRRNIQIHRDLVEAVAAQLESSDPATRIRALRALLANRRAQPEDVELVRPLLTDPDSNVREDAARTIRVLEQRLHRND
jgi:HEAT repeat protein